VREYEVECDGAVADEGGDLVDPGEGCAERVGPRTHGDRVERALLEDRPIDLLVDWRGKTLRRMRELIKEADPDVVEEWK
jgi:hypothetical protein